MPPQNGEPNIARLFYVYSFDTGSLASSGTTTDSVAIEADSDFILTKMSYFATDGSGAAQTYSSRIVPNVTVNLRDTGSGRNLFDEEQPIANIFGSGEIPMILPTQVRIKANSVVRASFTSLEASAARRVWLSMIGFKLYEY